MSIAEMATTHQDYNYWLARAIRGRLAEKGLAHKKVAERLDLSPSQFSDRVRGETPFQPWELARIVMMLGVNLELLEDKAASLASEAGGATGRKRHHARDLHLCVAR